MGLGIGRVSVAICLGAAGVTLAGLSILDWRADQLAADVVCEPAVDPEEVAAVIRWASSGPEIWRPETPTPAAAAQRTLAGVLASAGGRIAVPDNARAGGGRVSAIPGGEFHAGRWGYFHARRVNQFTKALNRTMAPISSRRP